ncbi:hypothetical protein SGFS_063670 [Streptomyces graminofaciens]|uniref:Uncharacterized protein n=1 Tax=Streptomyces graminofaciens TaxID=68212 RepID=A0ABN5VPL5_9ACTN|nr:hypothetical protein SGFS_063670 [Streptomyces graminofaciens]
MVDDVSTTPPLIPATAVILPAGAAPHGELVPPTPATVPVHAPRARSLRKSGLVLIVLYALLLAMSACLGDQLHASEQPYGRSAAASSEVPPPVENSEREILDAPDSPDRCHDAGSEAATFWNSSTRVPPSATTAVSQTGVPDLLSHDFRGATRRLPPSGGRPALISLCRWRV